MNGTPKFDMKKFIEDQERQARERLTEATDDKYKQALNKACLTWSDRVKKGEVKPLSQQGVKFEDK